LWLLDFSKLLVPVAICLVSPPSRSFLSMVFSVFPHDSHLLLPSVQVFLSPRFFFFSRYQYSFGRIGTFCFSSHYQVMLVVPDKDPPDPGERPSHPPAPLHNKYGDKSSDPSFAVATVSLFFSAGPGTWSRENRESKFFFVASFRWPIKIKRPSMPFFCGYAGYKPLPLTFPGLICAQDRQGRPFSSFSFPLTVLLLVSFFCLTLQKRTFPSPFPAPLQAFLTSCLRFWIRHFRYGLLKKSTEPFFCSPFTPEN